MSERGTFYTKQINSKSSFAALFQKTMNLSEQYSSIGSENDCRNLFFKSVPLRYPSTSLFYGLLVAAAGLQLFVCPFTILFNALVMVAVKTKRRLQTYPNVLLACLALTDLMVGLIIQPLHVSKTIFILQGKDSHEFCDIGLAFTVGLSIFCYASLSHLVLISGERYLAIKHTFTHASVVTKIRIMFCSALAWIAAASFLLIGLHSPVLAFPFVVTAFTSIIVFQILVYKEARRHEKHILSQQVCTEARAKFLQEKKALRLTTMIMVTIFLCFFFPLSFMFVIWNIFSETFSSEVKTSVRHLSLVVVSINSVLNPVIYIMKKRQFRVAFIELLLRKNLSDAEQFHRRLFESRRSTVGQQNTQEGEGQEQNCEKENEAHQTNKHEDYPEIVSPRGANFDGKRTTATQNMLVSSNASNDASKKTKAPNAWGGENLVHDKTTEDDNPTVLVIGPSLLDLEEE